MSFNILETMDFQTGAAIYVLDHLYSEVSSRLEMLSSTLTLQAKTSIEKKDSKEGKIGQENDANTTQNTAQNTSKNTDQNTTQNNVTIEKKSLSQFQQKTSELIKELGAFISNNKFQIPLDPLPGQVEDRFVMISDLRIFLLKMENIAKSKNFPLYSPLYLKIIKMKLMFGLIDTLNQFKLKDKGLEDFIKVEPILRLIIQRTNQNIQNCDFCDFMMEVSANTVIVSLGSYGDDRAQQCPQLADKLSQTGVVNIFNIDPQFEKNGFIDPLSKKNLSVFQFAGYLSPDVTHFSDQFVSEDLRKTLQDVRLQMQKAIQDGFSHILNTKGTKIILLDNTWTLLNTYICEFANSHKEHLGMNLEIISSGGLHDYPAFVYSRDLLVGNTAKDIQQKMAPAWEQICLGKYNPVDHSFYYGKQSGLSNEAIRENIAKHFSEWQKSFQDIGKLFPNLNSVPVEVLFQARPRVRLR